MKIAICDDDQYFLDALGQALRSSRELPEGTEVCPFPDGAGLAGSYAARGGFDLVFLDIEMPGMSGIEAGRLVRGMDKDAIIVLLTGHRRYVFRSFPIEPFDYLVKPVGGADLDSLLRRAVKKSREQRHIVALKWRGQQCAVEAGKVVCVEGRNRHTVFHTENGECECVGNLGQYAAQLAPYGFVRCHQSFLVNMKYIMRIEARQILTSAGTGVALSQGRRAGCLKAYNEYIARHGI
jgi:DNA-binding LytR/AlgR family response regulator